MATSPKAILIQVKDPAQVARNQGKLASFAQTMVPETIEAKVYSEIIDQINHDLRGNKVDADVALVEPAGWQSVPKPAGLSPWVSVGIGAGTFLSLAILWRFVGGSK